MEPTTPLIEEVDIRALSDDVIAELNAFGNILRAEDRPDDPPRPLELAIANVRNLPDRYAVPLWFVRENGELIAQGQCDWDTQAEDNKHLLGCEIYVLPQHRRRGLGTELLKRLVEVGERENRTLLIGGTSENVPGGRAFAEALGAHAAQEQRVSRLILDEVDRSLVQTWVNEGPARAPGYELVFVDGDIPDELMDDAIEAFHVMNTAPRDELDIEDWVVTPEMIREWEKMRRASGGVHWTLFVRHIDSGKLVGFTELGWNPKVPYIVQQMGTAVEPSHRGHALGKWLKADMLRRLFEDPGDFEPREIRTGNAESNDAMLGINVALGFTPWMAHVAWQIPVEQAKAYLATR